MFFELALLIFLLFLLTLLLFLSLYRYITKNFNRWENLGVPCIKATFPYGSHREVLTHKRHLNDLTRENYEKFKDEDFSGIYFFGKPVLIVNNMEAIRSILVKDFNSFVDRQDRNVNLILDGGPMDQVWAKMLTTLSGEEWKDVRSTFSPIFTSRHLRAMLKFITEVGASLKQEFGKHAVSGNEFELKTEFGKFSLDSLASCAFGFNPRSFEAKSNIFVKSAERLFTNTRWDNLWGISRLIPGVGALHKLLGINIVKPNQTKFFKDILASTIKHRLETGDRHNDLVDLMIDCIKDQESSELPEADQTQDQYEQDMEFVHVKKSKLKLDEEVVTSTSLLLLVAGYDTTSITLSYMAYYLAKNPEIQTKLQAEIDQAYKENNGTLPDYKVIQELPYIEMCILETLRLQTPVGTLFRSCTTDTQIPYFDHTIRKNDRIIIPVSGIHMDERYYPNPHQFNPENFSREARQSRSPYTFLGFGQGPRACIGMRFAMLESKVAMMEVLANYTFLSSDRNPDKLEIDPDSTNGYAKGGLYARVVQRN